MVFDASAFLAWSLTKLKRSTPNAFDSTGPTNTPNKLYGVGCSHHCDASKVKRRRGGGEGGMRGVGKKAMELLVPSPACKVRSLHHAVGATRYHHLLLLKLLHHTTTTTIGGRRGPGGAMTGGRREEGRKGIKCLQAGAIRQGVAMDVLA